MPSSSCQAERSVCRASRCGRPSPLSDSGMLVPKGYVTNVVNIRWNHESSPTSRPYTLASFFCKFFTLMRFSTAAIHAGQAPDPASGAVIGPISQSTTFAQKSPGKPGMFDYSRSGNPTRAALETCMAELESGKFGLAFASGLAASMGVLFLLKAGDHLICGDDVYGGTFRLLDKVLKQYGVTFSLVDTTNPKNVAAHVTPQTRMVWLETPTNPLLKLSDIAAIARVAKQRKLLFVVDNTFMSPYFQQPLRLGADVVLHSTTKYVNGHSDAVGGAVVTRSAKLYERMKFYQNAAGAVPGPMDSFLTLRGVKTLAVRMQQHEANALAVARFLSRRKEVAKVFYPGLPSHPQHQLAKKQMTGFGGMVTLELQGGQAAAVRFLKQLKVFTLAESLGGVESLAEHPGLMTHISIPAPLRRKLGISGGLVRLSVGIEDVQDILKDLRQALR